MVKIDHYLISRLNIGKYMDCGSKNDDPFTRGRVDAMKAFLIPSVLAQNSKDFTFIILVAEKTPQNYIDELKESCPNVVILGDRRVDRFKEPSTCDGTWLRKLRSMLIEGHYVLTSRIDSDDFLLPTFIEATRAHAHTEDNRIVIDHPASLNYSEELNKVSFNINDRVGLGYATGIASLLEPYGRIQTAYVCSHTKLSKFIGSACAVKGFHWVKRVYDKRGVLYKLLFNGEWKCVDATAKNYDEFMKQVGNEI